MGDLIDTTEMYLRTIYELREEGVPPLRARIAERLKQTRPHGFRDGGPDGAGWAGVHPRRPAPGAQ